MDDFILVIDDNVENLKVLGNILKESGYKIALAQSGKEALEISKAMSPLVIFLDVMMPEMDGYEVLDKLKQMRGTDQIPVIMVTAQIDAQDIKKALELGAVDYIKKPINKTELLARLRTTIRLREKELALQNMIKSKEEFIQMVAHDLRVPFAAISDFADMLLNDTNLSTIMNIGHKEYLKLIIDSSTFLVDYFNKLLKWASTDSGKLAVNKEVVNFQVIVQTAKSLYSSKLAEKEQTFINNCKEDIYLSVDVSLFQQIINNLLSNAIKYSPAKGQITIFADKHPGKVEITMRDTGGGIEWMTEEELFNKSFHKSTCGTNGEKGSGIGLHICKAIADAHSFKLSFHPAPVKGTDFVIGIPVG